MFFFLNASSPRTWLPTLKSCLLLLIFKSNLFHYFLCLQILGKSYQVLSNPLQRDAYDRNEKKNY